MQVMHINKFITPKISLGW